MSTNGTVNEPQKRKHLSYDEKKDKIDENASNSMSNINVARFFGKIFIYSHGNRFLFVHHGIFLKK